MINIIQDLPEELREGVRYQLQYYILNVEEEGQVWEDAPGYVASGLVSGVTAVVGGEVIAAKVVSHGLSKLSKVGKFVENQFDKVKAFFKRDKADDAVEGKVKFTSTGDAAQALSKNLNGTVTQLKNGYKIELPNANSKKPIVVRVMNEGSGGMTDDYLNQITKIVNSINGK